MKIFEESVCVFLFKAHIIFQGEYKRTKVSQMTPSLLVFGTCTPVISLYWQVRSKDPTF